MEKSKFNKEDLKYFKISVLTEMNIDKTDIFYREKYNEIINYLKALITEIEDSINTEYEKYIKPNACLLIHINPGNDVESYLKLIAKNYQLNLIELNYNEVIKNSNDFLDKFPEIIVDFVNNKSDNEKHRELSNKSTVGDENLNLSKDAYSLFILNDNKLPSDLLSSNFLLSRFINYFEDSNFFIQNKVIFIWITNVIQDLLENHSAIYKLFDLYVKIPILDKFEREKLLKSFSESNPKIVFDINTLVEKTQNWEANELFQLLKVGIFKHFLNSDLNDASNEITDILIKLIDEGEFIPSFLKKRHPNNRIQDNSQVMQNFSDRSKPYDVLSTEQEELVKDYIHYVRDETASEFMLEQLYENAASRHYNELLIISEKLSKNELLEDNERKLLAKYPFLLNDQPKMAQIHLEKAKKRIDQIRKVFGKED